MSVTTHIKTLNKKHHLLDVQLQDAYIHHLPNEQLAKIKKEKLEIKDEIAKLSAINNEETAAAA